MFIDIIKYYIHTISSNSNNYKLNINISLYKMSRIIPKDFNKNGKKIGFTCSCWDLLHAGHNMFLKDCKENCDILIVGLQTDPTIDRPEKNKPIQSFEEREIQVQSCRWVDYYFIYDTEKSLYDSIKDLQPDIRFLGDDYVGKKFTGNDLDIEIHYHKRSNHTYSTSNLRKIIYEREKSKI
jgi:glycerol-3-phosphate cytidylyltransferase